MIQEIYPHKLHNEFNPMAVPAYEDIVLNISCGKLLVQAEDYDNDSLVFPQVKHFEMIPKDRFIFLFVIDDTKYFLVSAMFEESLIPKGFCYVEERSLRKEGMEPKEQVFAAITGKHLSDWYRDTRFCGRCGAKMIHSKKERAMTCEGCHYTAYPRIMPAVIVGVINGDRILLTKYKTGFSHNALVAGFIEIGETVEETVAREVMEETGLRVKNIRYYKSQPWGSANDILLGFYCDVDGDDTITMDNEELKYAEWVKREDIILQPGHFSLTNEMMSRFKTGQEI